MCSVCGSLGSAGLNGIREIEESRVWLFFDCFDNNQDLGSEGRPAGC